MVELTMTNSIFVHLAIIVRSVHLLPSLVKTEHLQITLELPSVKNALLDFTASIRTALSHVLRVTIAKKAQAMTFRNALQVDTYNFLIIPVIEIILFLNSYLFLNLGTFNPTNGLSLESQCTPCTAGYYCQTDGESKEAGVCNPGFQCIAGVDTPEPDNSTNAVRIFMIFLWDICTELVPTTQFEPEQ